MSERTLKEILFTADGIKDKPMETDEQWELLYNKAAAERDKLKAQRDALLAAAKEAVGGPEYGCEVSTYAVNRLRAAIEEAEK